MLGKADLSQPRAAIVSFMIRYGNSPEGGLYLHYNYVVALWLGRRVFSLYMFVCSSSLPSGS